MVHQETVIEPAFDPCNVGKSLRAIDERLPVQTDLLHGMISGDALSRRRGHGTEPDGIKAYEPGDDPRHIDWNATARIPDEDAEPLVRLHHADITPSLWVVSDGLKSKFEANSGYFSKQQLALSAIMTFLNLADRYGMPFGYRVAGDHQTLATDEAASAGHYLLQTGRHFADAVMEPATPEQRVRPKPLAKLIRETGHVATESIVVVVSDFREVFDPSERATGWKAPLRELQDQGNEVIAVEVTSPWDFELPEQIDQLHFEGFDLISSGRKAKKQREAWRQLGQELSQNIATTFRQIDVAHLTVDTDDPRWLSSLRGQLYREAERRAA